MQLSNREMQLLVRSSTYNCYEKEVSQTIHSPWMPRQSGEFSLHSHLEKSASKQQQDNGESKRTPLILIFIIFIIIDICRII